MSTVGPTFRKPKKCHKTKAYKDYEDLGGERFRGNRKELFTREEYYDFMEKVKKCPKCEFKIYVFKGNKIGVHVGTCLYIFRTTMAELEQDWDDYERDEYDPSVG